MFEKSKIPAITPTQWQGIELAITGRTSIETHDLANRAGITGPQAIAFIVCLDTAGAAKTFITIYHRCAQFEMPCGVVPFRDGPVVLPWHCEACGELVDDEKDLAFGVRANDVEPIDFR